MLACVAGFFDIQGLDAIHNVAKKEQPYSWSVPENPKISDDDEIDGKDVAVYEYESFISLSQLKAHVQMKLLFQAVKCPLSDFR